MVGGKIIPSAGYNIVAISAINLPSDKLGKIKQILKLL